MTVEQWAAKGSLAPKAPGAHGPGLLCLTGDSVAARQPIQFLLVQTYACKELAMALSRSRASQSVAPVAQGDCEAWSYLDQGVLRPSRSRKVCMTCHSSGTTLGRSASPCSPASCTRG